MELQDTLVSLGTTDADATTFIENSSAIGRKLATGLISQLIAVDGSIKNIGVTAEGSAVGLSVTANALGFEHHIVIGQAPIVTEDAQVGTTENTNTNTGHTDTQPTESATL